MVCFNLGDGLEIKSLQSDHSEELFASVDSCRSYLRQWLPWVDTTVSPRESLQFIEAARRQEESKNGFQAGIWFHDKLVGCIGYHALDSKNRKTSIGYWLRADAQGKGIATRACRAMIDHAFFDLKMHRLEIRCGVKNAKSRAVPERLGLNCEGIARDSEWLYDHFVDHAVYAAIATEWKRSS